MTISGVMNSRTIANHCRRMSKIWQAPAMFDAVSPDEETYRSTHRTAAQSVSRGDTSRSSDSASASAAWSRSQ